MLFNDRVAKLGQLVDCVTCIPFIPVNAIRIPVHI